MRLSIVHSCLFLQWLLLFFFPPSIPACRKLQSALLTAVSLEVLSLFFPSVFSANLTKHASLSLMSLQTNHVDTYRTTDKFSSYAGVLSCRCVLYPRGSHPTLQLRHSTDIPISTSGVFIRAFMGPLRLRLLVLLVLECLNESAETALRNWIPVTSGYAQVYAD